MRHQGASFTRHGNGEAVDARQVANQIALRDAVQRYGVRRIFTFHRTVKARTKELLDRAIATTFAAASRQIGNSG